MRTGAKLADGVADELADGVADELADGVADGLAEVSELSLEQPTLPNAKTPDRISRVPVLVEEFHMINNSVRGEKIAEISKSYLFRQIDVNHHFCLAVRS